MNIRKLFIKIFLLAAVFFICRNANTQDLHYSQFYNSPQNINPALTGMFSGDHRFMVSMRDQWRFVPVPWFTLSGAYDRKFYVLKSEKHFIGGGINLNHDRQGDSDLNLSSLTLNGAYHRLLTPHHIVSAGLTLGFSSRGFNTKSLTWDKQWNGDAFNGGLPSGEAFQNFERINFFETGVGLNYRYQKHKRTFADIGVGVLHLVSPNVAYYDNSTANLPQRLTLSAVGQVKLLDILDIQLHGLHQIQDKYDETVIGGLGKIYISQKRGKEVQLHVGLGYRTAGSYIPTVALQVNNIYAGFSYDIDTNQYNQTVGSRRGGPEIHVRYIIANVPALKEVKVCPIY